MTEMRTPNRKDVYPYPGGNEIIDRLLDGTENLWIANGPVGRRIMYMPEGATVEDAQAEYIRKFGAVASGDDEVGPVETEEIA